MTQPELGVLPSGHLHCFLTEGDSDANQITGQVAIDTAFAADIQNFRFHDLRHTWASWHVMNGTSLQELMELGGWKSYEMVLRYAHLAPEHLADAAARIEKPLETVANHSTISLR